MLKAGFIQVVCVCGAILQYLVNYKLLLSNFTPLVSLQLPLFIKRRRIIRVKAVRISELQIFINNLSITGTKMT